MSDSLFGDPSAVTDEVELKLFSLAEPADSLPEHPTDPAIGREAKRLDRTWRQPGSDHVRSHPTRAFVNWPTIPEYVILGELGRGGMGVVYLAQQKGLHRVVALKMVSCTSSEPSDTLERFRSEAEAAARLQHPNIVQIYDIGEWRGLPFFSLEFMEGGSLDASLERKPQPPQSAAKLVETLARAAHHAHEHGIIHRDLKPSNILLGGDGVPKISDFGLAKRLDQSGSTKSGEIMGTPSYMAPEQAAATSQPVGPSTDVYALGAILHEMLTGRPPFLGASAVETVLLVRCQEALPPRRLQPGIPRDLEIICLKCLEKAPTRRYATAQELADDLRRFQAGEPIHARPTAAWEKAWKLAKRRPAVTILLTLCSLATLALFFGTLHHVATVQHAHHRAREQAFRALNEKREADKQREEAQEQKKVADANYQLAREAVDEYVKLVRDHPRLQGADLADVRKTLTQTALKYYQELVKQNPQDPALRSDQGRACWMLADLLADYESKASSIKVYEQARVIFEDLVREDPKPLHRFNLAQTHVNLGYMQMECSTFAPVGPHYQTAAKMLAELLKDDPDNLDYLLVVAKVEGNWGCLLTQTGHYQQAVDHFRDALQLDGQLVGRQPRRTDFRNRMGHDLASLGIAYRQLHQYDEAEKAHRDAIAVFEKLAMEHPRELRFQIPIARGHGYLGFIKKDLGQLCLAEVELFQALEIQEALARQDPQSTSHQSDIGITCNDLGGIFRDRRDLDRAATMFQRAAEAQAELVARDPSNLSFQVSLAGSLGNRAHVLRDSGQREWALEPYTKSISLLEGVLKKEPQHRRASLFLRNAAWGRASVRTLQQAYAEALSDWDLALEMDKGQNLANFTLQRAYCAVKTGRHAEATEAVDALLKNPPDYRHLLYNAAEVYSLASALVAADPELSSSERQELAERHAARAVELLAKVQKYGYFDKPPQDGYLSSDGDLNPLRGRDDFKKLLAEPPPPRSPSSAAPPPEKPSQ